MNNHPGFLGRFDPEKTLQLVGLVFQELGTRQYSRMSLLKLLYIADRESVRETGGTLTGDQPYAMDWGPVPSATYGGIKEEGPLGAQWAPYLHSPQNKIVVLVRDPGTSLLSPYEIDQIRDVTRRFGHLTAAQLSRLTHTFEEWKRNRPASGSRQIITERDVLEAVGRSGDADRILAEAQAYRAVDELFDSVPA